MPAMSIRALPVVMIAVWGTLSPVRQVAAPEWPLTIQRAGTPAGANSAMPQVTVSSRGVLLSWIEQDGQVATLKYSERKAGAWSPARVAQSGTNWFVNWADVPSVLRLESGTLVAHWLQKSGSDTYAYDVMLAYSGDDGKTWSAPVRPHSDGTRTEHGFASLFQAPGGGLGLVWLDGRAMQSGNHGASHSPGEMSVRFGSFGTDWKQSLETPVDLRVCECCPTAVAVTSDGPIVAYRDRSPNEVRDIYVSRLDNGKWTPGVAVNADNWQIAACPVNGPSLSASGREVAVAWFTGAGDQPRALAAFSSDSGRTFGAPIRLDDVASLGRVDVELLRDGSAAAAYVEFADQHAQFRMRRVDRKGSRSSPLTIAEIAGTRSSGYPRVALSGREIVFAWTDRQGTPQVHTAVAVLR